MKKCWFVLFVAALLVSSCSLGNYMLNLYGSKVEDRATAIVTIPASDVPAISATTYSFIVLADVHFGAGKTNKQLDNFLIVYKCLFDTTDETKKPRFLICLGDITDNGEQCQADDWIALEKKMKKLALGYAADATVSDAELDAFKIYSVIGNHDLYSQDGWDIWKRNFFPASKYGSSYYRFTTGGFSYYFLDSGNGTLGEPQLNDLELNLPLDPNPKLVFMHYPIVLDIYSFCLQNTLERNRLMRDFARSNVRSIFTGHFHSGNTNDFGNLTEKTVPSFGYKNTLLLVTVDKATSGVSYQEMQF
ncbi:MAG: metallophosphoesterase [Treponema sp.]|nr:metallophosphoesterase [Treponema sp.]